jgi:AcrR family transcriptional regulator
MVKEFEVMDIKIDVRRKPKQDRSRATSDFILQAALELISQDGYANLTTNNIAERAGVNIASLYRYFPNKEAVVTTLFETVSSHAATTMKSALTKWIDVDIDEAMPRLVKIFLKIFQDNEIVLLRLPLEMPELRSASTAYEINHLIRGVSRMYFEQHCHQLSFKDVETALFFTENNILGNVSHFILNKPEHITTEKFVMELSRSIIAYLRSH